MKRAMLLAMLLGLGCLSAGAAEQIFYSHGAWPNPPLVNWTVQAGTPYFTPYYMGNASSDPSQTRVVYSPAVPTQDYSTETWNSLWTDPNMGSCTVVLAHYLRVSGNNWYEVRVTSTGEEPWAIDVYRVANGGYFWLASTTTSVGGYLKSSILGSTITVSVDRVPVLSVSNSAIASGQPGVGTQGCYYNQNQCSGIATTTLAYIDTQPPTVPGGLAAAPYATHVNLSWNPSTDNIAVTGYKVYRGGNYIGSSSTTSFTDPLVDPLSSYSYTVSAYDAQANQSAQSSPLAVNTPALAYSALETGGPVEYAAAWGGQPDKIGLLNGVLALRIPLPKFQHRSGGPGFQMTAAWNSQFWSWDTAGTKMSAMDVGYGLGFYFMIGGIYPVYQADEIVRFEFQDAGGVIHKLYEDPPDSNKWKSRDSSYMVYDSAASPPTLSFTDGTVWFFECVSRYPEPDAGTRYPTRLRDTNGNLIDAIYMPATGLPPANTNTSGRLKQVTDTLTTYLWYYTTINGRGHVSAVYHAVIYNGYIHSSYVDAQFTYETRTDIVSPLGTPHPNEPLTAVVLKQISFTGSPGPYVFTYNSSAEITKVTLPYKGYVSYDYLTASFSDGARKVREMGARRVSPDGTLGAEQLYSFSHPEGDLNLPQHTETTLADAAGNSKVWQLIHGSSNGWDNGLESRYEVRQGSGPTSVLKQATDTTWTQDNPASQSLTNPRVSAVVSSVYDGEVVLQSKAERDVDGNGNVTAVREYGFGNLATPHRTTATTYLSNTNYTSRNILNRPLQVTVRDASDNIVSQTTITYDVGGLSDIEGITQHDPSFDTMFVYRGNPVYINANGLTGTNSYDVGGNLYETRDPLGHLVSSTNYLPNSGQVSHVASGGSATDFYWNGDTTLDHSTGSNSDTTSVTYWNQSFRPKYVYPASGGWISYTFCDMNAYGGVIPWTYPYTKTVTIGGGTTTVRTFDGLGRVTRTAVKETASPESWIYTDTQYDPCSCNPMGKAVKQSRPYRAGETPVWTETTFDALGRPVQVTLPDGARTNYAYSVENSANWKGTATTITDPLGKQKRYLYDAFGRLLRVDEQPGGDLVETARYNYDIMGRLLTVRMGKINETTFKQTRTFVYNTTGQLVSATNPENGTVSYTYAADGLLQSKADAKSQTLWYAYDTYHRLTQIQSPQGTARTTFGYDYGCNGMQTTNAIGRLTCAWSDSGYTWHLGYDGAGRVATQTLELPPSFGTSWPSYDGTGKIKAGYGYDAAGQLTLLQYPGTVNSTPTAGTWHKYTYDLLGRPLNLQYFDDNYYSPTYQQWVTLASGAAYNAASQITGWQETASVTPGWQWDEETQQYVWAPTYTLNTLTRAYNAQRGWLESVNAKNLGNQNLLDLHYRYQADGRVSGVYDTVYPALSSLYRTRGRTRGRTREPGDEPGDRRDVSQ